jgi:hypothetical protein
MKFWREILVLVVLSGVVATGILCLSYTYGTVRNFFTKDSVLQYKGQTFILYGFTGEGYTKEGHIPVYSAVFIPLEAQEKYESSRANKLL